MFNPSQKLRVRTDHPFHAGKIGYFQFMGGPNQDCVVLAATPTVDEQGCRTMISVGLDDCEETE